jgi:hypothetical protein
LHALFTEMENLLHYFVDGAFTAVENGTDLDSSGFDEGHGGDLIEGEVSTRLRLRQSYKVLNVVYTTFQDIPNISPGWHVE